jgi:lipopolysaccharide export system ATP-binding protein
MRISATDLVKKYRARRVVDGVSIEMQTGEVVGLLGPNGAGKTTTFYMITGLVKPGQGRVFLDDSEITKWPMYRRARSGIGYLPQEALIFRRLTVEENLRLVLELRGVKRKEQRETIDRLLSELGMESLRRSRGGVLSGGERRRVEIARALASEPKFILLDEPFTGIDPRTIEELQSIILSLRTRGIGILITDHNVGATLGITDRNYILVAGKIIKEGDSDAIKNDPEVRKHYLGEQFE